MRLLRLDASNAFTLCDADDEDSDEPAAPPLPVLVIGGNARPAVELEPGVITLLPDKLPDCSIPPGEDGGVNECACPAGLLGLNGELLFIAEDTLRPIIRSISCSNASC